MAQKLRYAHTTRTLEECEKPWGVEWGLTGDNGKTHRAGPYRTEAEAKMTVNAINVQYRERRN